MNNLSREFSSLRRLGLAVLLLVAASSAWGQATVTGMNQVSSTRVGRTTYDYTYTINVANGSPGLTNAVATVTSSAAATVIVQGSVALGTLAAGASITSTNTFTLQQDRLVPFNPAGAQLDDHGHALRCGAECGRPHAVRRIEPRSRERA